MSFVRHHVRRLLPAFSRLVGPVTALAMVACRTLGPEQPAPGVVTAVTGQNLPREVTFWQPWLLYNHPAPYATLHVEVDAVAGCEPDPRWLQQLRDFLTREAGKPGGVTVRLDDVIPRSTAATLSSSALALRHIDGPDGDAAFMYVLYYDSSLNASLKTANPHAIAFPYPCAIFIDRNYNEGGFGDEVGGEVLVHEAGHLLGAARSYNHGDGAHCRRRDCIMNAAFEYSPLRKWVGGKVTPQQEFCPECRLDLARWRAMPPAAGLRFDGPLLVRDAGDYQVYALPNAVHLHAGTARALNRSQVIALIRKSVPASMQAREGFIVSGSAVGPDDAVLRGIAAAKQDPAGPVKTAAQLLEKQFQARRAAAPAMPAVPALVPASPPSS